MLSTPDEVGLFGLVTACLSSKVRKYQMCFRNAVQHLPIANCPAPPGDVHWYHNHRSRSSGAAPAQACSRGHRWPSLRCGRWSSGLGSAMALLAIAYITANEK